MQCECVSVCLVHKMRRSKTQCMRWGARRDIGEELVSLKTVVESKRINMLQTTTVDIPSVVVTGRTNTYTYHQMSGHAFSHTHTHTSSLLSQQLHYKTIPPFCPVNPSHENKIYIYHGRNSSASVCPGCVHLSLSQSLWNSPLQVITWSSLALVATNPGTFPRTSLFCGRNGHFPFSPPSLGANTFIILDSIISISNYTFY